MSHHKYRVDTTTYYPDGRKRRSYYFAKSIAAIAYRLENSPRATGFERHGTRQFDVYDGYCHTVHHVSRVY